MRKLVLCLIAVLFVGCVSQAKKVVEPMAPLKDFQQLADATSRDLVVLAANVAQAWTGLREVAKFARMLQGNDKIIWLAITAFTAQESRNFNLLLSALKRRGIKLNLDKEADILDKKKKAKEKNKKK